mgnify:CR=1 FL=1
MAKRTQHTIGLDIGTSRVTCIACEPGESGLLNIVGDRRSRSAWAEQRSDRQSRCGCRCDQEGG